MNREVENALDKIISGLTDLKRMLVQGSLQQPMQNYFQQESLNKPIKKRDNSEFEQLKALLNSDQWPAAINTNLVCDPNSEKDKLDRAKGVVELMIEEPLKNKTFLDFGCGEGHATYMAAKGHCNKAIGYDIKDDKHWSDFHDDNLTYTTNFSTVVNNGPYDVILLFDVIDHTEREQPLLMLKKVNQLLKPSGKIYTRCHPFTSRHATHLYNTLNKAYIHLVFTPQELKTICPEVGQPTIKIMNPRKEYGELFEKVGLKEVNRRVIQEEIEDFFKTPLISNRIMKNLGLKDFPPYQFIDFCLEKS